MRRIGPDDWRLWRDVRLTALADAPEAFCSTLEREQAYDEERWREWAAGPGIKVVAFDGERPVGVAGGDLREDEDAELFGMWVASAARGSGLAGRLVREVMAWAAEHGRKELRLWVADDNARATRLYEKLGFAMVDGQGGRYNLMVAETALR